MIILVEAYRTIQQKTMLEVDVPDHHDLVQLEEIVEYELSHLSSGEWDDIEEDKLVWGWS